ncbi:TPA: hypothetical protein QEM96_001686 [Pseudomonas putida]|nr:hypothetical protein [Pseudomonas putida]
MSYYKRRKALANKGISTWMPLYDEVAKGVRTTNRQTHRTRESIWLALCCFENGLHLEVANDLIEGVLAQQDTTDRNRAKRFNFKWYYHQNSVSDYNGLSFVGPVLAYLYMTHRACIRQDLIPALQSALRNGKMCVQQLFYEQIPVTYTNVYVNQVAYLIMVGDEDKAAPYVARLYEMIRQGGINEYCSWAYLAVQLNGLQAAYVYAQDRSLKEQLRWLLTLHWVDGVHHYHKKTSMLSCVGARVKDSYGLNPSYDIQTLMYLYFDAIPLDTITHPSVESLMSNYQPGYSIGEILRNKTTLAYQAAYGRVDVTVYQTDNFSLSTQTGRRSQFAYTDVTEARRKVVVGHESEEHDVQLVYYNENAGHRGIRFHTYDIDTERDDYNHHWVTAVQHDNKAIVSYHFDPNGAVCAALYSEACLGHLSTLAPGRNYSNVRINGNVWKGQDLALTGGDVIAFRAGSAYVGIRLLATDVIALEHPVCTARQPVYLSTESKPGKAPLVWLRNYVALTPTPQPLMGNNYRLGYVIEMADAADFASSVEFGNWMQTLRVEQCVCDGVQEITLHSGADQLYLKENLRLNMPLARRINGVEFDNHFILKSPYVSLGIGEDLSHMQIDTGGGLFRSEGHSALLTVTAEQMIIESPMACEAFLGSYGKVIHTTEKERGSAGAIVDVPHDGDWYVWARVFWLDTNSNSFTVRFNNDDHSPRAVLTDDTYAEFHWLRVPVAYFLARGRHWLRVDGRETGARLDRVIITDDLSYHPAPVSLM